MQWEWFSYQYWNISCCGCNNNPFLMGDAWICRIWTYFLTSNPCGRAWNFLHEEIYRFNFVQPFANILTKPHNRWTRQTVTGYIRNIAARNFLDTYTTLPSLMMSNSVSKDSAKITWRWAHQSKSKQTPQPIQQCLIIDRLCSRPGQNFRGKKCETPRWKLGKNVTAHQIWAS